MLGELGTQIDALATQGEYERAAASRLTDFHNDIEYAYYGHFHKSDVMNMYGTQHRLLGVGELWEERD